MHLLKFLLWGLEVVCALFLLAAVAGLVLFRRRRDRPLPDHAPAVTVLKPLCGLDHGLEENLCSFCRQDYPRFQIVFGVREANDPAAAVVRRVLARFPRLDAELVVDPHVAGRNLKVSNLCNMLPRARHDILVIADSDMRVGPDYLRRVAAEFADPAVGAVTCLYSGTPAEPTLASSLGALHINDWFAPAVLVALLLQAPDFCFGSTMAVRRQVLTDIGGMEGLLPYLADDCMLGHKVRAAGHVVKLSGYVTENVVREAGLRGLFAHELRWFRTIRCLRPLEYPFTVVSNNGLSIAALAVALTGFNAWAVALAVAICGLRLAVHALSRRAMRVPGPFCPWLLPLRDVLSLALWLGSYVIRDVRWRGASHCVLNDGRLMPPATPNLGNPGE